jgi:hypothetical protein
MKLKIFRAGTWKDNAGELVNGGRFSPEHILEIARNTMRAIATGWLPAIKFGHVKDDSDAAGWVKSVEALGPFLYADCEFSDMAQDAIRGKRRRHLSAEIVKNRTLTGDDDSERLGLMLNGLALLGSSNPAVRDIDAIPADAAFSADAIGGKIVADGMEMLGPLSVAYFAEVEMIDRGEPRMTFAEISSGDVISDNHFAARLADEIVAFAETHSIPRFCEAEQALRAYLEAKASPRPQVQRGDFDEPWNTFSEGTQRAFAATYDYVALHPGTSFTAAFDELKRMHAA